MDSPASVLARPSSKISSTLQAMTQTTHHSLNHAATGLIACYLTLAARATVCLSRSYFLFGRTRPAYEQTAIFIFFPPLLCAVNSIILLTNGISFATQAITLPMIGAWADYGKWRYA